MRSYAPACITAALCTAMLVLGSQVKWHRAIAADDTISGPARIIDGDTVVVGNTHVRLKGVDAAERGSPLGDVARLVMIRIVGNSDLTCHLTGEHTWRREVGFCFTADGTDINRAIIEQGAALACPHYSDRYMPYEQTATIKVQQRAGYCLKGVR